MAVLIDIRKLTESATDAVYEFKGDYSRGTFRFNKQTGQGTPEGNLDDSGVFERAAHKIAQVWQTRGKLPERTHGPARLDCR